VTADERDELVRDLERAGVQMEAVQPRELSGYYASQNEWQLRCRCPDPAHCYTITDAKCFRQAVRDGLTPVLPRGELD
jgi:hypothetical protein